MKQHANTISFLQKILTMVFRQQKMESTLCTSDGHNDILPMFSCIVSIRVVMDSRKGFTIIIKCKIQYGRTVPTWVCTHSRGQTLVSITPHQQTRIQSSGTKGTIDKYDWMTEYEGILWLVELARLQPCQTLTRSARSITVTHPQVARSVYLEIQHYTGLRNITLGYGTRLKHKVEMISLAEDASEARSNLVSIFNYAIYLLYLYYWKLKKYFCLS